MTPSEIEQRFARNEERIAALENELMETDVLIRLLIGSHPEPAVLLRFVEASIRTGQTKRASAKSPAGLDRVLARLEQLKQHLEATIEDRDRARQKAAAEKQRQRDELGKDIGRGGAAAQER